MTDCCDKMLNKLFSKHVIAQHATTEMWEGELYPEEQRCIPDAVTKRYREFTAGRLCARKVLKKLGVDNFPLLVGDSRQPLWPPGVVGSISHCYDNCVVAATKDTHIAGLGIDVEDSATLEAGIKSLICRKSEEQWVSGVSKPDCVDWAKIIFSAKESVYKCLFPLKNIYMDFREVEIEFDLENNEFFINLFNLEIARFVESYTMTGRFSHTNEYVYTSVELHRVK